MILYGLTGGIGMGKSTAARLLQEGGVPVIDTDVLARAVVEPGQPALGEIVRAFGPEMLDGEGCLRRDALARVVFADEARRRELEAITHPRIRDAWLAQAASWKAEGRACGVVVIPLLYETAAAPQFDRVVCVACSARSQRERLQVRGWAADQIEGRLAAQWPVQKKMDLAHYVVWTEPGVDVHAAQLRKIFPLR
jgi:dephospho-CoA kinase